MGARQRISPTMNWPRCTAPTLQDIEIVERFCSERHFSIVHLDAGARSVVISGSFGDVTSAFGADVELHRLGARTYRSRRGHLSVPEELAGRVLSS